jgi:hypothetical protein
LFLWVGLFGRVLVSRVSCFLSVLRLLFFVLVLSLLCFLLSLICLRRLSLCFLCRFLGLSDRLWRLSIVPVAASNDNSVATNIASTKAKVPSREGAIRVDDLRDLGGDLLIKSDLTNSDTFNVTLEDG